MRRRHPPPCVGPLTAEVWIVRRRTLWLVLTSAGVALAYWLWHASIVRRYGPDSTIEHMFADGDMLEGVVLLAAVAVAVGVLVWIVRTGKLR
jgi:hypothetical protein